MPSVGFQYKHKKMQTIAVLSEQELEALRVGNSPRILLFQNLWGVHDIDLRGISSLALKSLIRLGCCFDEDNRKITDVARLGDIRFTIFQRPVLEYLSPILEKLGLLPLIANQCLMIPSSVSVSGPDPRSRYLDFKKKVLNFSEIPAYSGFSEENYDHLRQALFRELYDGFFNNKGVWTGNIVSYLHQRERSADPLKVHRAFFQREGIQAYLRLAEKIYDITGGFNEGSLRYAYVKAALALHKKLEAIAERRFGNFDYGRYSRVISLVGEFDELKRRLSQGKVTIPVVDFSEFLDSEHLDLGNYKRFRQQVLDYMATPLQFAKDSEKEKALFENLDRAYRALIDFAVRAVGKECASTIFMSAIPLSRGERGFLFFFEEHYIKFVKNYQGEEQGYFKEVWRAYVSYLERSYVASEDTYQEDSSLQQEIDALDAKYVALHSDVKDRIKASFNINEMKDFFKRLFDDFLVASANSSKQIIADQAIQYLQEQGLEQGLLVDRARYSLMDSQIFRRETFKGEFIHANFAELFSAAREPRENRRTLELEDLISPAMLEPHVQQLLLFRPPLIVLALLVGNLVGEHEDLDLYDYKQKIAGNLVNHPLIDAAIVACLRSDENVENFRENILNPLLGMAQRLLANPADPHRFAADFFNDFVLKKLQYLPPIAKQMLQQAQVISPKSNPVFLVARLLKAICSDLKAFSPDVTDDIQGALQKVAEALGMIGLDNTNVLTASHTYDGHLLRSINANINEHNPGGYIDELLQMPDQAKRAAAGASVADTAAASFWGTSADSVGSAAAGVAASVAASVPALTDTQKSSIRLHNQ